MINLNPSSRMAVAVALACLASAAMAKKPLDGDNGGARSAYNEVAALDTREGRFAADGRALTLYVPAFKARAGTREAMAREFLLARAGQLGLANDPTVLTRVYERDDDAFHVVRFSQMLDGVRCSAAT